MDLNQLKLSEFNYDLPNNRIASHPLEHRDRAKLLVYNQGNITHHKFGHLPKELPENTLLVFNDTRVIPARLVVHKETGARIEVFLLSPHETAEISHIMQSQDQTIWLCMVGNKKRWSDDEILTVALADDVTVRLSWDNRDDNIVQISWNKPLHFAQLLELWGKTPLPPYIKRDVNDQDKTRYQTVYADKPGAVAAPTAGLHFTPEILQTLNNNAVKTDFVTLHVGAGTFKPVTVERVIEHDMHSEPLEVSKQFLQNLVQHTGPIIPVGTTAMRVLESLYWLGVQAINGLFDQECPFVDKLEPYQQKGLWSYKDAIHALIDVIGDRLVAQTQIMIMPGYDFKICRGLITNFHQPKSTLLMLIAAFTGGDEWQKIYQIAMENDYRFLSYGDSSLILP